METLKVKMLVSIVAADWSLVPGQEVELDTTLADSWLAIGHATKVKGEKVDKTALAAGVEYLGFGRFGVKGWIHYGKAEANEAAKGDIKSVAQLDELEVGEELVPEDSNPADDGANNAGGDQGPS